MFSPPKSNQTIHIYGISIRIWPLCFIASCGINQLPKKFQGFWVLNSKVLWMKPCHYQVVIVILYVFTPFFLKELCPIWPVFVGWVANQRLTTLGVSAGEPRWQKIAWFWPCVPVGWLLFRLSSDNGRNLDLLYRWVVILSMMVNHNQITIWGYLGSMFVSTMS